jgi:predicted PurR-regulated permease PerM
MDQDAVMGGLAGTMLGTLGSLFAWLLLPVFLFFLLKDQPVMAAAFYARLPQAWRRDVRRVLVITIGDLLRYLKAELLIGSLMLLIVTLGMVGIGTLMDAPLLVRFAILLGLIALVLELIPQIGPILSCLPALMLAFPTGVDVVIAVSLFYFVAFNVEGSILVPTFQGRANHFSGAVVLVIVTTGFALAGMIGAALALPLASLVRDLLRLREHAGPRPAPAPASPHGIRVRAVGEVS